MKTQIIRQQILLTAFAIMLVLTLVAAQAAQAQTFKVLYDFTAGLDGYEATGGLTWDTQGNLYGVTAFGGTSGYGTAFELAKQGSSWVINPLHSFKGGADGTEPLAPLALGPDHTTFYGTTSGDAWIQPGTVFSLVPGSPPSTLYSFTNGSDGTNPGWGALVFDNLGNLYGTTTNSLGLCTGPTCGNVYQLQKMGNGWVINPLYTFTGGTDGGQPYGGVIFGAPGHLYGATDQGGTYGNGVVYELILSGATWTEKVLYNFTGGNDGYSPDAALVFDNLGNLYGTTALGGSGGGGTAFMLSPATPFWKFTLLHSFTGTDGPETPLTMDAAGNFYGTTYTDGAYGYGSVYKLTRDPTHSVPNWKFSTLHDFTGQSDGFLVSGGVILDSKGNLYGETWAGGKYGGGIIFEITP